MLAVLLTLICEGTHAVEQEAMPPEMLYSFLDLNGLNDSQIIKNKNALLTTVLPIQAIQSNTRKISAVELIYTYLKGTGVKMTS